MGSCCIKWDGYDRPHLETTFSQRLEGYEEVI